jgi:hypothetical protein
LHLRVEPIIALNVDYEILTRYIEYIQHVKGGKPSESPEETVEKVRKMKEVLKRQNK